jgi:preprotein translocase subunit SecA
LGIIDFLNKALLGDPSEKAVKRIQPIVEKINSLESEYKKLSKKALADKTKEFKERLGKGETLDELLPEAFAAVREASRRTLGMRHFDVQLVGGVVLHEGNIAEMKTGEGKTLVATLPIYLNALSGKGVHLVTVNDYLARRDASWMGPIYHALGMSVSAIGHELSLKFEPGAEESEVEVKEQGVETSAVKVKIENMVQITRREAYQADITYGTNNEFGFDYLRDNMATDPAQLVQRGLNYAIVDEVDSILIDEARTPLIISAPAEESAELYQRFAQLVPSLVENEDYNVDEKLRAVTLTDSGIEKMEKLIGVSNIYEEGGKGLVLVHHLEQALKAQILFKKDRDYVVKDGEIIIVDEFTGRLMYGRRYSEGLHQAIEAKEHVEIKQESITLATITFQNYFRLYGKLAGMTGTAMTEAEEFRKIYNLDVFAIPTHRPMIRKDLKDVVYKTSDAKFRAITAEIKRRHELGQPVLVGTISIEKNEMLSEMLKREGVPHNVLNAKHHEREAEILAQAGKLGAVTVATNMAGRGVDIILGGNPPDPKEAEKVKELGGLYVLGSERHEARRIDNQLRGRSGRQGDPGSSQFFLSLEDDLMRIFGGDRMKSIMDTLRIPEDQPIENSLISKSIESAQKKVELHNFDIRKHVVQYDDVMNKQREAIYSRRRKILLGKDLKEEVLKILQAEMSAVVKSHTLGAATEWNLEEIFENVKAILPIEQYAKSTEVREKISKAKTAEEIERNLFELVEEFYQLREKEFGEEAMRILEKLVLLRTIDHLWVQHLDTMDHLREGIGLRGYGQRDPLVEYKSESFRLYQQLLDAIQQEVAKIIFKVAISVQPAQVKKEEEKPQPMAQQKTIETGAPETQDKAPQFAEHEHPAEDGKEAMREALAEPIEEVKEEAAKVRSSSGSTQVRVMTREEMKRKFSSPYESANVSYSGGSAAASESGTVIKKQKVGRNDPCPCGSGLKYKKCHGK